MYVQKNKTENVNVSSCKTTTDLVLDNVTFSIDMIEGYLNCYVGR